jgi:hypothetical protein
MARRVLPTYGIRQPAAWPALSCAAALGVGLLAAGVTGPTAGMVTGVLAYAGVAVVRERHVLAALARPVLGVSRSKASI